MPAFVEEAIVENLIKGYAPKRVEAQIPTLCFYGQRRRQLSEAYTAEQKAAFELFIREVRDPSSTPSWPNFKADFLTQELS